MATTSQDFYSEDLDQDADYYDLEDREDLELLVEEMVGAFDRPVTEDTISNLVEQYGTVSESEALAALRADESFERDLTREDGEWKALYAI